MRLTETEINNIKQLVKVFDACAKVYLYGSRVDDSLKGGDIDLLIISSHFSFKESLKIKSELSYQLGEQKVDVLIAKETTTAFIQLILETAIVL